MITSLHHIQIAMPQNEEEAARGFYAGVLGMTEVAKPDVLAGRGGVWFEAGAVRLHLGVETPFIPARKAHPAFQVKSLADVCADLDSKGIPWRTDVDLPGITRIFVADPFGNRIEILQTLYADGRQTSTANVQR